jgi:hypothetical protein
MFVAGGASVHVVFGQRLTANFTDVEFPGISRSRVSRFCDGLIFGCYLIANGSGRPYPVQSGRGKMKQGRTFGAIDPPIITVHCVSIIERLRGALEAAIIAVDDFHDLPLDFVAEYDTSPCAMWRWRKRKEYAECEDCAQNHACVADLEHNLETKHEQIVLDLANAAAPAGRKDLSFVPDRA